MIEVSHEALAARERYARLRAAGLCVKCTEPVGTCGLATCIPCAASLEAASKKWRVKRAETGNCVRCGLGVARAGAKTCVRCSPKPRRGRPPGKRRPRGGCTRCRGGVPTAGFKMCASCRDYVRAYEFKCSRMLKPNRIHVFTCGKCGNPGHNRRVCQNMVVEK